MPLALEKSSYTLKNVLLWGTCIEHLKKAKEGPWKGRVVERIGHGIIGVAEVFPFVSIIEAIVVRIFNLYSVGIGNTNRNNNDNNNSGNTNFPKAKKSSVKPVFEFFKPKNLAEATAHAFEVFSKGDGAIKSLESTYWIVEQMYNPADPEFRKPNSDLSKAINGNIPEGHPDYKLPSEVFVEILDAKTFLESDKKIVRYNPVVKRPKNHHPDDTPLTSLSLSSPGGAVRVFTRKGCSDLDYATCLIFDGSKIRHNQTCAYWGEDSYSSWRGWKLLANNIMLLGQHLFPAFLKNLLPNYEALKKFAINQVHHNELLSHVSKGALVAIGIRSGMMFHDNKDNLSLKYARFRSICEKIIIQKRLGKELPILVLNHEDPDGTITKPRVYTIEEQRADWQKMIKEFSCEWGQDPSAILADHNGFHGLSRNDVDNYFARV